ncbi:mannosylglycerate hydrolase [Enterococcus faecium]|nr:mannosylglycerate hydrolase [Enterococcus faecium]
MKNVHVVPHVHWDREWYFSAEESKILLVNDLKEVLDFLEEHEDYPSYVLDGQTSIIDDFAKLCPEEMPRFEKMVQAGRLIIGPWYTQTDEMVVGGESIVRNLTYGIKDSKKFGEPMMIGYLPDSFGQTSQMPQILNGFEIDRSIFWRGISERHGTDKTEFIWKGAAGSQVTTQLFPLGYAIGKYLPTEKDALKKRMDKYFSVLDRGATTNNLIVPNGHDQMPIQKNIFDVLESLRALYPDRKFFLSRYENIFEELEKTTLPEVAGEFIDGKYSRVHRSIFSTRMDLKVANTRIENKITNILEPLMSIAYTLGFAYQSGTVEAIWKNLMENHAHDSMGACCSDKVHAEIAARFKSVEERVDRLIDFYMRKIAEAIPEKEGADKLVVYNFFQNKRKKTICCEVISKLTSFQLQDSQGKNIPYEIIEQAIIDPGLIDRQIVHYGNYDPFIKYTIEFTRELPSVGYEALYLSEGKGQISNENIQTKTIENRFFKIVPQENGTVTIIDKHSGETYTDLLNLENVADDGDEYDFSPLLNDQPIYSADHVLADIQTQIHRYSQSMTLKYDWKLPKDLTSRKEKIFDGTLHVELELSLKAEEQTIALNVLLNNGISDQRTRMLLPTGIASNFSLADNQFGLMERPVKDEAMDVWEKEEWDERPDSIYPFLSHVSLADQQKTFSLLTNSSREYEIIGKDFDTIAITLMRSVGYLGKEELLRRPGRPSGIKLATPDSQLHGKLVLSFGLYLANTGFDDAHVALYGKEFLTKVYTYNQIPYNAMKLNRETVIAPTVYQLYELTNPDLILSTIKKSESTEQVFVRFYNSSRTPSSLNNEVKEEVYRLNETLIGLRDYIVLSENEICTISLAKGNDQK